MRKQIFAVITSMLIALVTFAQYVNLSFTPSQPEPGDKIQFEYSATGTVLGGITDFEALAYLNDGSLRVQEITLKKNGNKWIGEISTNDSTKVVFIYFKKDEEVADNNREKGYTIPLYKEGKPVKGAYAATAETSMGFGSYLMRLKTEPADVVSLYEKEFTLFPDQTEKYLSSYINALMKADKENAKKKAEPYIQAILDKKIKTENDYASVMWAYTLMKDKASADKLKELILKEYPKGQTARNEQLNKFYEEKDFKKKEALLALYIKSYPPKTENEKRNVSYQYSDLAVAAGNKKDWSTMNKYAAKVTDKASLANTYNSLAWKMAGEGMDGDAMDLPKAKELSGKSLALMEGEISNPSNPAPYYTAKQNKRNTEFTYGMFMDTYALILWKLDEKEKAYEYQEKAVTLMNRSDAEANERYIVFKEKIKGSEAVQADIEELLKKGKSSQKLKEIFKKNYLAAGHSETEYNAYMDAMMIEIKAKIREELIKKMINDPAPKFALKDLNGNAVSLEDLKGKVVVLDFWATWCGPCRASFPGMQIAVDKYKEDTDVKFLFVDSWENKTPEEIKKNAEEFIKKNKYSFTVVLDHDNNVIQNYAVEGIPTKFIVDKEGRIRFKAIGYGGNMDQLVAEMDIMIEVTKNGISGEAKKAF